MILGHTFDLFPVPAGGLRGATVIDSLDTLYLMELKEEFQEAKAWVEESFHLNVVSQSPSGVSGQLCPEIWDPEMSRALPRAARQSTLRNQDSSSQMSPP